MVESVAPRVTRRRADSAFGWRSLSLRARRSPRTLLLAASAATSVLNYAFGLAAGWLLLPDDFGLLAFAQTVLLIAGLILNAGFPWSLTAAIVRAEQVERAALVRGTLVSNLVLALVFSNLVLILFALGPLRHGFERPSIVALVALALPFIAVAAVTRHAAQGVESFGTAAVIVVLEVLGKAIAGLALIVAGFGVGGAVAGFALGGLLAAIVGLAFVGRHFEMKVVGPVRFIPLLAALPVFGASLGLALLLNLDLLAVKLLVSDREQAGFYQASTVLANAPYYLAAAALVPVMFTRLAGVSGDRERWALVAGTLRRCAIFLLPVEALLIVAPELALRAFFPDLYAEGAGVLRLLALGNGMMLIVAVLVAVFQATGQARRPAIALLCTTAIEAAVLRAIVPSRHSEGAALVFVLAAAAALLILIVLYRKRQVG